MEIKEAQRTLSGNGDIKFGSFQAGLNLVLSNLAEDEIEELKETAKKWNLQGPPEEEKQRSALVRTLLSLLMLLQTGSL